MQRRAFLTGATASLATPALAAEKADRTFRVIRDGDDIGTHRLDSVLGPNGLETVITVRISVKFLGITAFRYELDNREVWKDGRMVSLDSKVFDDGRDFFARARRAGDGLAIEGTEYSGPAPGDLAATSYYARDFLDRKPWMSSQSGRLMDISFSQARGGGWTTLSGDLRTSLRHDASGEWVGCEFDAGGAPAEYEVIGGTGGINALWTRA